MKTLNKVVVREQKMRTDVVVSYRGPQCSFDIWVLRGHPLSPHL